MLDIADVVDLELALRRGLEPRAKGGKLDDPRRLLRSWLDELRRDGTWPGRGVKRALALFRGLLIAIGLGLGVSLALAAFARGGGEPVNVVRAWGMLVAPQLLLLLVTLVALLRARGTPGLHVEIFDLLGARRRERIRELLVLSSRYRVLLRWWVVESFQIAAVAANVAMLATLFLQLTYRHYAFGWETTFDWTPEALGRAAAWIAAPWNGAIPLDVVRETRWTGAGEPSARSLVWWPFLAMSILVYGFLPRAILLIVARLRLRREESAAFERGGDYRRLEERLRAPRVETGESPALPNAPRAEEVDRRPPPPALAPRGVLLWQLPAAARGAVSAEVPTHGLYDPDDEPRAIQALASAPGDAVWMLVPAWGNATTGLKAFVRGLRAKLGEIPLRVEPVDEADGGGWAPGSEAARAVWRRDLADLSGVWVP